MAFEARSQRFAGELGAEFDPQREGATFALTPQSHFTLDYIAPSAELSDYVTTFYHFRCDEEVIRDIQPAAIGHLVLFPYGEGSMMFRDGSIDPAHEVNLLTPFSIAAPFEVRNRFHAIGAALSPLGWAALTGLAADEHGNRLIRAGDHLGPEIERLGHALCEDYRAGRKTGTECAAVLGDFIAANLMPVNPRHAQLIAQTNSWLGSSLSPSIEDLYSGAAYSQRQVQRLIERYFGLPPKSLVRKYRALRAAMYLSLPQLTPEFEAQLGEAFYDQSHMIREIQLFVGRTPARLADDETPYLAEMLTERNFREIDPTGHGGAS